MIVFLVQEVKYQNPHDPRRGEGKEIHTVQLDASAVPSPGDYVEFIYYDYTFTGSVRYVKWQEPIPDTNGVGVDTPNTLYPVIHITDKLLYDSRPYTVSINVHNHNQPYYTLENVGTSDWGHVDGAQILTWMIKHGISDAPIRSSVDVDAQKRHVTVNVIMSKE